MARKDRTGPVNVGIGNAPARTRGAAENHTITVPRADVATAADHAKTDPKSFWKGFQESLPELLRNYAALVRSRKLEELRAEAARIQAAIEAEESAAAETEQQ